MRFANTVPHLEVLRSECLCIYLYMIDQEFDMFILPHYHCLKTSVQAWAPPSRPSLALSHHHHHHRRRCTPSTELPKAAGGGTRTRRGFERDAVRVVKLWIGNFFFGDDLCTCVCVCHSLYLPTELRLQVSPYGTTISGWVPWCRDRHGDEELDVGRLWVGPHPPTMEEWVEEGRVSCVARSIEM